MKIWQKPGDKKPASRWLIAIVILAIVIGFAISLCGCGSGGGGGGNGSSPPPVQEYGSAAGTVTDGRAMVQGALVQVVGYSLLADTTDGTGSYRIDNIPTGNRTLRVSRNGYTAQDVAITIVANQVVNVPNVNLLPSRPQLDSINPARDTVGALVTISGLGFGTTQGTVTFNGAAATVYSSWTNIQIVCQVPNAATTGVVRVIASGVQSTENISFTVDVPPPLPPVISSLNPTSGPTDTRVTISGSNFGTNQGTSVATFTNQVNATSYASWSSTQIICAVPAGTVTGNVTVTTATGTSNGVSFTVTGPLSYTFVWRKTGLNVPRNMTVDLAPNICLANVGERKVARYDLDGNRLSDIGDGTDWPKGVARDSNGNHYVASEDDKKILTFDSNWSNKAEWPTTYRVRDVAAEYGNAVVTLGSTNGLDGYIEVFDRNGDLLYGPWLASPNGQSQSAAIGPDNMVYVAERIASIVKKFTFEGTYQSTIGSPGTGNGQLQDPTGIDIGPDGKIYIADWSNYRFQVFDSAGTFLAKFGSQGNGDGQFQLPNGICVDNNGNVYIVDAIKNDIQKFTPNL